MKIKDLKILVLILSATFITGNIIAETNSTKTPPDDYINLKLTEVSLSNTLQLLAGKMGKNLMLDPSVNDIQLSMTLNNITSQEALAAILQAHNLAYKELEGNVLYIAHIEKIGKQMFVQNISCKYAKAVDMANILKNMIASHSGRVMADARTNTLVLKESPEILRKMKQLVAELDKPTEQVYIQAEVLEISTTDDHEFGIEWLWKNVTYNSTEGRIGTDFELQRQSTTTTSSDDLSIDDIDNDGFPFPTNRTGLGIGILNSDVEVVLHALGELNNVNLLSRPRVITMDNQEAQIEVGDQIPFRKLNEFGVTSFEFKDATIQLLVTPHIIDSSFIMLDVSPKADFQNGFTLDGTPIISTRKASTSVKVRDGQAVVIGGLIRDSVVENQKKFPLLGDIPILGNLFKSKKSTKIKTELIFFITPKILHDNESTTIFDNEFKTRKNFKNSID